MRRLKTSVRAGAPANIQLPNSFVQEQGEVWAAFDSVAADGGRRQLFTNALSVNLGTAVLKTLLVSFDLRPPTAELWLPSSCQVAFKPSLIAVSVVPSGAFPSIPNFKDGGPPRAMISLMELPELCRFHHIFFFSVFSSSVQVG